MFGGVLDLKGRSKRSEGFEGLELRSADFDRFRISRVTSETVPAARLMLQGSVA